MVIGITGTNGAGKGTIVGYLVSKYGFKHFSFRDFLSGELKKEGVPVNRDTLYSKGNELRTKLGAKYFSEIFDPLYQSGENYIVESIRTPSEVNFLKSQANTYLFAVDADPTLRFQRAFERKSDTDKVSFEKFIEQEERELQSNDPNEQNLLYCRKSADRLFLNNKTVEDLSDQVDAVMSELLK